MLQIGLIGLGGIAEAHLKALALLEAEGLARCVAGAEPVAERREERRQAFGIPKVYASHRDLLADPDVEAVGVLLPHHLHASVTIEALEAGKHVLLEKPMAVTMDECDRMIEAEAHSGRLLQIGLTGQYRPALRTARAFLDTNALGPVIQVLALVSAKLPYEHHDRYLRTRAMGGGEWLGDGVHMVDWVTHVIGTKAVSVKAVLGTYMHYMSGDDTATALIQYANGVAGVVVLVATSRGPEETALLDVHGAQGRLQVHFVSDAGPHGQVRVGQDGAWRDLAIEPINDFAEQYRDFVRAIATNDRPPASSAYGRHIMEILFAAERSSVTGREVVLQPLEREPW